MAGEITTKMSFSTYDDMVSDLSQKYNRQPVSKPDTKRNEAECLFIDREIGNIKAHAFRENMQFTRFGTPKYANAVIFNNNLQYGTCSKTRAGLNVFDYIQGKTQYALDLNGNNKVDEDEIFDGKLDRYVYKKGRRYAGCDP